MSRLRNWLAYGALQLGFALGIGCSPRTQPTVRPPLSTPRAAAAPQEARDEYLDLSAIAKALALPELQQQAIWRTWAREHSPDDRQRVALGMLARRADPSDVSIMLDAFEHGTPKIQRAALRALLVFGPELSRGARERLWSAVLSVPKRTTPELIWALVTAQDPRVYEAALNWYAYGYGPLSAVKTIDGANAFDAALIGALNLERTLPLAQSPDPKLRLLVAETCSRVAQTECTPWLMRLVRDPVARVSAAAAPGLAKIGSVETHQALTQALRSATQEKRGLLLESLREEAGLTGLVAALDSVSPDPELGLSESVSLLGMIGGGLASQRLTVLDPRGVDALDEYLQHAPHLYLRTGAALLLAQLGDLRALPALAARLRLTPEKAYPGDSVFERAQRRDDTERVTIANTLSDLADLDAEHLGEIRRTTEDALLGWLRQPKLMHPAALRALAKMRSPKIVPSLRAWASATQSLPKRSTDLHALSRADWSWAMESLKALGLARDSTSLTLLEKSADDPLETEVNRLEACRALAWVFNGGARDRVLARLNALRASGNTLDPRFGCFLETFAARAAGDFKPALLTQLDELTRAGDVSSAFVVARALGRTGIVEADEDRLLTLLQRADQGALPAALALLVGARPEMAQLAALRMLGRSDAELEQLKNAYGKGTSYISEEDLRAGALYRWVGNAFAVEQAGAAATHWPREALAARLAARSFQSMPHPMNSTQFRLTTYQAALEGSAAAIETLQAAGEAGALLAVRDTPGPGSYAAYRAHRRLSQR